jgi:hypothetical protein
MLVPVRRWTKGNLFSQHIVPSLGGSIKQLLDIGIMLDACERCRPKNLKYPSWFIKSPFFPTLIPLSRLFSPIYHELLTYI